ncbi:filamentous hemagglutinin N-terminal domain-containing protein [Phormidium sp. CLA17]|uniref:two-partner secretion domain-containing protein n=1 Tax=Leptolyngbya sp. Cla-17 TaxID=2803751 RepID=UPI001492BDFD|nr:filamentous hemagglutinin N-terminal domain-containing protein [Leptolyngbya sp. Cla-17]MBM0743331.1 filamentous hemagglutinin N-terminal domain-containing protein [Leptolyngbya sp. Cla-17]
MNQVVSLFGLVGGIMLSQWIGSLPAASQMIPDATLPINSQVAPGCTTCMIDGGTVRGVNLFHSFKEFSIPTGGAAWFNNTAQIQNILTRVTGNSLSNIDGLLKANGAANLFLLNPNGIVFGSNAQLQIGGSFFASTAPSFKFADGSEFSATQPQASSLLTVNVPLGLQYGKAMGDIHQAGSLEVTDGQSLTLYGNTVMNTGTLRTAGGTVQLLGDRVALLTPTQIDVSSTTGGGTVRIGGDLQGQGTLPTATATYIDRGAVIRADGLFASTPANGGTIVVWSNASTKAYGTLTARSQNTGNGGLIETSSAGIVDVAGIQVDASAANGLPGNWLIDPRDIIIQNVGASTNGTFSGTNPDIFTPIGDSAIIATTDIQNRLNAGTSVTITTGNTGTQAGNITIADNITKNPFGGPATLTLTAANDILLQPGIQIQSFFVPTNFNPLNLILQADSDNSGSGSVILNGTISSNAGQVSLSGRTISLTNGSVSSGIPGTPDAGIAGGAGAITLTADTVSLDNSRLQADTYGGGDGQPIIINAGTVSLNNNSSIGTITWTTTNNAGNVTINAPGSVSITNNSSVFSTSNGFSATQVGDAGFITINGGAIAVNQGRVASTGNAQGLAGIVINAAAGSVDISNSSVSSIGRGGDGAPTTITAIEGVRLTNSFISSRGLNRNAGPITVSGKQVEIDATSIAAQSFFTGTGGAVAINATDAVTFTGNSRVSSESFGVGDSGPLNVRAGSRILVSNSELTSSNYEKGNAGDLTLSASSVALDDKAQVLSIVRANFGVPNASGNGGQVAVDAQTLTLTGGSTVSASTFGDGNAGQILVRNAYSVVLSGSTIASAVNSTATGSGGNIDIQTRSLLLTDGGQITANTTGRGQAGDIVVNSRDRVTLTGANTGLFAQTSSATGAGGSIAVTTDTFQIANTATLNATTSSQSQGGNITVNANNFNGTTGSQLLTTTSGGGQAGNITVNAANQFNLRDANTGLFASTSPGTTGEGGSITLRTGAATIAEGAQLAAIATGSGNAGKINAIANSLELSQTGQILTTTSSSGRAGDITVDVSDHLTLTDANTGLFASTLTGSSGDGGSIFVKAPLVGIYNNAALSVDSQGSGQGGDIALQANRLQLEDRARLTAETTSANGGNLMLDVRDLILLRRNSLISTTAGTAQAGGNGGNIFINTPFIVGVLAENSDIRANAFTGNGGKISISAFGIYGLTFQPTSTPFSDITASSQFGISGQVLLDLPNLDPTKGLTKPPPMVEPIPSIRVGCAADENPRIGSSRFVILGQGGLPLTPDEAFSGDRTLAEPIDAISKYPPVSNQPTIDTHQRSVVDRTTAIIEAQGWVQDERGTISLIAQPLEITAHNPIWTSLSCSTP